MHDFICFNGIKLVKSKCECVKCRIELQAVVSGKPPVIK